MSTRMEGDGRAPSGGAVLGPVGTTLRIREGSWSRSMFEVLRGVSRVVYSFHWFFVLVIIRKGVTAAALGYMHGSGNSLVVLPRRGAGGVVRLNFLAYWRCLFVMVDVCELGVEKQSKAFMYPTAR